MLFGKLRTGDQQAAADLMDAFYPELKRIAVARMKAENQAHSWQASDLVSELYVELAKIRQLEPRPGDSGEERDAFFGLASHIMRRLLCGHARRLYRRVTRTSIEGIQDKLTPDEAGPEALYKIDQVLKKLEALNPRLRSVVELRAFEGLSGDEIAERLGCSRRTVLREWSFARQLISKELGVPLAD